MSVRLLTSHGAIKVELECDRAPATCANFLALCAAGYYEGTAFHRNMRGFMVQGGDPTGTGKGGESVWGGTFPDEFHAELKHSRRGVVSMANKGPDTNRSQFFITYAAAPHLDNVYAVFGRVLDGFDALDRIEGEPVGDKSRPVNDVRLLRAEVLANPLASASASPELEGWAALMRRPASAAPGTAAAATAR